MKKTAKRLLLISGIMLALLMPATCASNVVFADDAGDSFANERSILGLRPWYYGLTDASGNIKTPSQSGESGSISIGVFAAQIVLNIVNDLLVITGYLVTGFIIYGGYLYMFSEGDPSKAAKGKNTIKMATIGAIIAISSNIIFNTISIILLDKSGSAPGTVNMSGVEVELMKVTATDMIGSMINWALSLGGLVSVIFIVYGGVSYMTAAGDAGKLAKAKNSIKYAVIGLIIVILASVMTNFIFDAIIQAQTK